MPHAAALPTYGVIAVWPTAGCAGSATYQQFRVGGGALASDCLDVSNNLAVATDATYGVIVVSSSGGTGPWTVSQYSSTSDCTSRSSNNFFTRAVSQPYDAACYNFLGGSFSMYQPGQPLAPAAGTVVAYPPMHSAQYAGTPVPTAANELSAAVWLSTPTCSSGTAGATVVRQGSCYNTPGVPGSGNLFSYTVSCDTKSATSAWTFTDYSLTGCQAAHAASPKQGNGPTCVRSSQWGGSIYIDCAAQTAGLYVNYLPLTDGGWSAYGDCVGSCGSVAGTQTRTCTSPAPSGGGAACIGPATQACTTSACGPASTTSSTGAASSTGSVTGATVTPAAGDASSSSSGSAPGLQSTGSTNSADTVSLSSRLLLVVATVMVVAARF